MSTQPFPNPSSEADLSALGNRLGVNRDAGENLDAYRARVAEAWSKKDEPAFGVLGGITLGGFALGE